MDDWDKRPEPRRERVYTAIEERSGWQRYIRSTPIEAVGETVAKVVVVGLLYEHCISGSVRKRAWG